MTSVNSIIQSQLAKNIFSNYFSVIWMGGLSITLIPFYLRKLGSEQWGIVAICMSIQAFFNLLDAGLTQIMPRDIAKVSPNPINRYKTYLVYSRAYLTIGLCGFLLGQISIPWLIENWFIGGEKYLTKDSWAFHLVILQFLFQFSNFANIGYWNGLQLQTLANIRQCIFGTLKHASALTLVYFWHADAVAYLIPFVMLTILEFSCNRYKITSNFKDFEPQTIRWSDYKQLSKESGALFIGVLIGTLASQMDRIVLSRCVDASSFGIYAIVANLGLAVMQIQHPLIRAFLPQLTIDHEKQDNSSFKKFTLALLTLCIFPCLILAFLSPWVLDVWINNPDVVAKGTLPLRLFFCAVAFNAIYQLAYQRILVRGEFKWIIKINIFVLVIIAPLILYSAPKIGILAGAIYWLAMTALQLTLGAYWCLTQPNKK